MPSPVDVSQVPLFSVLGICNVPNMLSCKLSSGKVGEDVRAVVDYMCSGTPKHFPQRRDSLLVVPGK